MALTKEQLISLGVPESAVAGVLSASYADTKAHIDGNYVPKNKLDATLEKLKAQEALVAERDAQIVKLGQSKEATDTLQKHIEELTKQNQEASEAHKQEMAAKDKQYALRLKLQEDGCVDPAEVAGKFNLDDIVLDASGNVSAGYDKQRDAIKAEKAYYFTADTAKTETNRGLPPGVVVQGQTPPDSADTETVTGPEAEAQRLAKIMLENQGSGDTIAQKASAKYFGTAAENSQGGT